MQEHIPEKQCTTTAIGKIWKNISDVKNCQNLSK